MTEEKARRQTRKRAEITSALAATEEFTSAQSLFAHLREGGASIGLATVYRTLNDMAESGDVDVARTESGEQLYRLCGAAHHHHLICTGCGQTIEIQAPLEEWLGQVAATYGYADIRHVVDLYGLCPECQLRS